MMIIDFWYKRTGAHRFLLMLLSLFVGLVVQLGDIGVSQVYAATIIVTPCDEVDLTTAISNATSGDTIAFGCSGTITLSSPLSITKNLTLDGSGHNVTLDGNNAVRVLQVSSGVHFTLSQLTIAHGYSGSEGGAISNNVGATVSITNSTFASNSTGGDSGGAIINYGTVNITNSTFTNNSAPLGNGGAIYNSGNGTVGIINSTFANNSAKGEGGAIYSLGTVGITNSTIADNNSASLGDAISNAGGVITIRASIVANIPGHNCAGSPLTDQGYNLENGSDCSFTAGTDLHNTDPKLDPAGLQNNGGFTQTIALMAGSPAIDHIPSSSCSVVADQRGVARPQGAGCDIGAFELQSAPPPPPPGTPLTVSVYPNPVVLMTYDPLTFNVVITSATPSGNVEYLDTLANSNNGKCHNSLSGHTFTADTNGRVELNPVMTGTCLTGKYKVIALVGSTTTLAEYEVLSPRP